MDKTYIEQFKRDGFVKMPGFIPDDILSVMRHEYNRVVSGDHNVESWKKSQKPGEVQQLSAIRRNIPGFLELGYLELMVAAASELQGMEIGVAYDQLIYKPPHSDGETPWHQDAGYWRENPRAHENGLTCWLALDTVTPDMGSMRFIPGSHLKGIADHADARHKSKINGALEATVDESEAAIMSYEAGDVTFHHARTLHYTPGNTSEHDRLSLVTHLWPPKEE